jgi:hypothetical protein
MLDVWYGHADALDEEQAKTIEEACGSVEVSKLRYGPTLLRYLAVHSGPEFKKWRTIKAIRDTAFHKRFKVPAKLNIPHYLRKLQLHLDEFFDNDGSGLERRIKIQFSAPGQKHPHFVGHAHR